MGDEGREGKHSSNKIMLLLSLQRRRQGARTFLMLYVICDPVAEKEKLSFIGHMEEMSWWGRRLASSRGQNLFCEEEDSRGKERWTGRDADHTLRESPSSAAANMCALESFFFFNWGHFQRFPSTFPALGKSQAHLWHLADSLLSEGKVANESLCNCLCYKPKYTTASFTLTTQRAFFLLNWKCGTQQSL